MRKTIRPGVIMSADRSCLIVGAGMAGLTAASALRARGWSVILLDKGRGVGGRMATRRIGESRLDHGAQFFTVRDARFREAVDRWQQAHWVAPWFTESGHTRYRAVGGMSALAKQLSQPFDVHTEAKVLSIEATAGKGWRVATEAGEVFVADALLLTPPAPQSAALLQSCTPQLPADIIPALHAIDYDPCFALLVTLDSSSRVPDPGYLRFPSEGPIEWIADNTKKGVSTGPAAAMTIHARADFSRQYLEAPQEEVARILREAVEPWLGTTVTAWQLHRWKYSRPVETGQTPPCLFTPQPAPLTIAGDAWGSASRLEGAFLSGLAAAEKIASGQS